METAVLMKVLHPQKVRAPRVQKRKAHRVNRLIPQHPAIKLIAPANNPNGVQRIPIDSQAQKGLTTS